MTLFFPEGWGIPAPYEEYLKITQQWDELDKYRAKEAIESRNHAIALLTNSLQAGFFPELKNDWLGRGDTYQEIARQYRDKA